MNKEYTEHLILNICKQPRSLDYITHRLNGVDAISAFGLLNDLEARNLIRKNGDLWLVEEKARKEIADILNPDPQLYLKKYMGDFDVFKKPHPLDFEWRNTKKSIDYLAELVLQSNQIEDDILILGMPTLFANLCKRDVASNVTIVERNKGVINTLKEISHESCKVIEANIFKVDPESIGKYSTVVMDPPWYTEHFKQFIWVAARSLKLGGRLIISIPPINTRPNIDKERIDWFDFCQQQGLCLENLFAGKLEYAMPFFEWNANNRAGVSVSPFWRKGDVAIFQKLHTKFVDRPDYIEVSDDWHEVEIDNCRIRVKISTDEIIESSGSLEVNPLVHGQILATVSSRDPIRKKANIWTSGNRIFETNDPKKFYMFLKCYEEGIQDNSEDATTIFDFIKLISSFETQEYNDYLAWFYFEMERNS